MIQELTQSLACTSISSEWEKSFLNDTTCFFQEKAAHEEESIAFALATVVNQLPISKMSSIDTKFREELGSLRLDDFFNACADAAEFVQTILRPYIALKLNSRKQSYPHSAIKLFR